MKKLLGVFIVILLAAAFAGCTASTVMTSADKTELPLPIVQHLQSDDMIGFWMMTNYCGDDAADSGMFIEFTDTKLLSYQDGEYMPQPDESFSFTDGQMKLFSKDYVVSMNGNSLLLVPQDPSDPLMIVQKSSQEEMMKLAEAANVIDASMLTENAWAYKGYNEAPGASADTIPLFKCETLTFQEGGVFKSGRYDGTYTLEDDTINLNYTLFGRYTFHISVEKNQSKGRYEMSLMTDDQKVEFTFCSQP